MTLPNFLIIGAAKAGTTSLYAYLNQHPQVFLSTPKEPRFFALEGQAPNYGGPTQLINERSITQLADYEALFADAGDAIALGEASTIYLSDPRACDRIVQTIPEVKLIAILRDPASRAYSSYLHLVRDGQETLEFGAALAAEAERIQENWPPLWHYRQRGYYAAQLKPYFERFRPEQIRIYLYEDLVADAEAIATDCFEFLGVDSSFKPNVSERMNISGVPKYRWLSRLLSQDNPIKTGLKAILPKTLRKNLYRQAKRQNLGEKTTLSPELRQQLVAEYRDDILALQDVISRDLSRWLT
jgi:hypothetical protein